MALFNRACGLLSALVLLLIFVAHQAVAAWPNDRLIITDLLDDDIRALITLLSDPQKRGTIKAIVVSTGNTPLKAAIAKSIIARFGLEIPVYAGAATDLADNPSTHFAANFEAEGRHILDEKTRMKLKDFRVGEEGNGAQEIQSLIESHSKANPLDVLLLAAPIDLVKAIGKNPAKAKGALGDLFSMGFYKETPDNKLMAPYNTMAGPRSLVSLLKYYQDGVFDRFYHVPTDTIQNRTGLPGGYFPEGKAGIVLRAKLARIMQEAPSLKGVFKAAQEYGLSWWSSAAQDFGTGLTEDSRWVKDTLKEPEEAAGFYIADTVPALLSNETADELAKADTKNRYAKLSLPGPNVDLHKPFALQQEPFAAGEGRRPLTDVESFDGLGALQKHFSQLEKIAPGLPKIASASRESDRQGLAPIQGGMKKASSEILAPPEHKALVMTFKNSPDDWFALIDTLSKRKGREALTKGGIICEGFQTHEMALAVKAVLEKLGIRNVPVAAGYEYSPKEVDGISNFKGEVAFYGDHQAFRAFKELPEFQELEQSPDPGIVTADKVISNASDWAKDHKGKVDLMILGEGIDSIRAIKKNSTFADHLGDAFVMGGGRTEPNGKLKFTRNWIVHRNEVLNGLDEVGKRGGKVYVFSTNEFGGMLVSHGGGALGNGADVFKGLGLHSNNAAVKAIKDHWANWTRTFNWVIKGQGAPFDPNKPTESLTISPLGLHIADAWSAGSLSNNARADWAYASFSPSQIADSGLLTTGEPNKGKPDPTKNIFWMQQTGGQKVEPMALRFQSALRRVVDNSKRVPELKTGGIAALIDNLSRVDDTQMIRKMTRLYPELNWLTGQVAASPDMAKAPKDSQVMSETLFGKKHAEFDRTGLSLLIIKWILDGNYAALTGPQKEAEKLKPESFQWLRKFADSVLKDREGVDAMLTFMTIHDLGKVEAFDERARELGIKSVDHDKILTDMLAHHPEILPSYQRLSPKFKKMIKDAMDADFNMGQFLQGENVPASLANLKNISPEARDFYMFHVLMDIAGVTGHVNTKGSMVLTEPTFQNFRLGIESLKGLSAGRSVEEVYHDYIAKQGHRLGISTDTDLGKAAVRLALMIRAGDPETGKRVESTLRSLDTPEREALVKNLSATGTHGTKATLLYYSPAFLSNLVKKASETNPASGLEDGLSEGLRVMASLYRAAEKAPAKGGVVTINIKTLADLVKDGKLAEIQKGVAIAFENDSEGTAVVQPALQEAASPSQGTMVCKHDLEALAGRGAVGGSTLGMKVAAELNR